MTCRGKAASSALTQTTEDQASALMSALGQLEPGTLFFDKYFIQAGQRRGQNSIIALAHERSDASQQVRLLDLSFLVECWVGSQCRGPPSCISLDICVIKRAAAMVGHEFMQR